MTAPHDTFTFVPLQAQHLPMLHAWLASPHAAQWWQPTPSIDELHADYIAPSLDEPGATHAYVAQRAGQPDWAAIFERGLRELHASGEYMRILKRHNSWR